MVRCSPSSFLHCQIGGRLRSHQHRGMVGVAYVQRGAPGCCCSIQNRVVGAGLGRRSPPGQPANLHLLKLCLRVGFFLEARERRSRERGLQLVRRSPTWRDFHCVGSARPDRSWTAFKLGVL